MLLIAELCDMGTEVESKRTGENDEAANVLRRTPGRSRHRADGRRSGRQDPCGWDRPTTVPSGAGSAARNGGFDRCRERTPRDQNISASAGLTARAGMTLDQDLASGEVDRVSPQW